MKASIVGILPQMLKFKGMLYFSHWLLLCSVLGETTNAKMVLLCKSNDYRLQPIANSVADPVFPDSMKPMEADTSEAINSQG
jgi:hypothetical protein